MALFEPSRPHETEEILGSDAATRALSVTAVENDFVTKVYEKLATVYDFTFGPVLHPGRVDAIERMGIRPGDRVLEVGVGTGINAALYPRDCSVTGVDLSSPMLEKARERVAKASATYVCCRWTPPTSSSATIPSTSSTHRMSSASCRIQWRSRARCAASDVRAAASSSSTTSAAETHWWRGSSG